MPRSEIVQSRLERGYSKLKTDVLDLFQEKNRDVFGGWGLVKSGTWFIMPKVVARPYAGMVTLQEGGGGDQIDLWFPLIDPKARKISLGCERKDDGYSVRVYYQRHHFGLKNRPMCLQAETIGILKGRRPEKKVQSFIGEIKNVADDMLSSVEDLDLYSSIFGSMVERSRLGLAKFDDRVALNNLLIPRIPARLHGHILSQSEQEQWESITESWLEFFNSLESNEQYLLGTSIGAINWSGNFQTLGELRQASVEDLIEVLGTIDPTLNSYERQTLELKEPSDTHDIFANFLHNALRSE